MSSLRAAKSPCVYTIESLVFSSMMNKSFHSELVEYDLLTHQRISDRKTFQYAKTGSILCHLATSIGRGRIMLFQWSLPRLLHSGPISTFPTTMSFL